MARQDNGIVCDQQEVLGLLSQPRDAQNDHSKPFQGTVKAKQITWLVSLCLFLVCSLAIILSTFLTSETPLGAIRGNGKLFERTNTTESNPTASPPNEKAYPQFSCLAEVHEALNADGASFDEAYTNASEHIIESNITAFIENFRDEEYDAWGKTYNEVKAGLKPWKIKHYANNLKNGDIIYESAIGIGLNVFLTLEAIQEVKELTDIKVFGNEYIAESVTLANKLLGTILPQVNASLGTICQGDSSDLRSFVPEESMDLVFSGYIRYVPSAQIQCEPTFSNLTGSVFRPASTLINPLNFDADDIDEMDEMYDTMG